MCHFNFNTLNFTPDNTILVYSRFHVCVEFHDLNLILCYLQI
jgi:hypothetical protein